MKKANRILSLVLTNGILIFVIILSILPFLYMILMSLKNTLNSYDISMNGLSLQNYISAFQTGKVSIYFWNSLIVAICGVIFAVTICCMAAYAFAKLRMRGSDKIFFLIVMTMIVPSEVIIVPLYLIVKNMGWLNTYQALILPLPTAFGVFIMRQAILAIPDDLLDSAKIDGCSDFKILWKVVLPLVQSSIIALAIFVFIGAWNNFLWPLIVSSKDEMKTLPLALGTLKTQYDSNIGMTMACATINFLPPFIFYLVLQSKFKEGMTLSGLKG